MRIISVQTDSGLEPRMVADDGRTFQNDQSPHIESGTTAPEKETQSSGRTNGAVKDRGDPKPEKPSVTEKTVNRESKEERHGQGQR